MRLSALDATFLELEDASPAAHMHVGAVLVFAGSPPPDARLMETFEQRLPALPRFGQRLSGTGHGTLRRPEWVGDERFDLAEHVRRAALPAPGGRRELEDLAADFWSHRLDRDRPLWELLVVEGLADGRWALVTKTHHCMVDGVGAVDAAHLMLDGMETPPPRPHADRHAPPVPVRLLEAVSAMAATAVRDGLVGAPASSLTVPIGPRRRFRSTTVDLEQAKAIKARLGGTVNDVVLALVAGGLRRLLVDRGDDPPASGLRAMVPVNVRGDDAAGGFGNHVSAFFAPLAVAEDDPVDRYLAVVHAAEQRKHSSETAGAAALVTAAGWTPPLAHALIALPLFGRRLFNLTVTNVRGPEGSVYAFGSPLLEIMPLVPLAADHALGVAVVSYDGSLFFGLVADRDRVPDLDVLADGIEESAAELRRAAGLRQRPRVATAPR